MVTDLPPDSVMIDGFVYDRRDEAGNTLSDEAASGSSHAIDADDISDGSLKAIQRSLRRARQRSPDEINPEPYVMLGGLWLSTQLFR